MKSSGLTKRNAMKEFTMSLPTGITRALTALALVGVLFLWLPQAAQATHYPQGSKCYDCHAVSASSMLSGTKMIRNSAFVTDLVDNRGWSAGQPMPCVYCHRAGAVSVAQTSMKPVDAHFGTAVASKHNADYASAFGVAGQAAIFDCLDCHRNNFKTGVNLDNYVSYNAGTGDATVHGIDVSAENIPVMNTLVTTGATPTAANLTPNCSVTTCHGGATDQVVGNQTAKKAHTYDSTSKGTQQTAFTDCTGCHASHRGEKQGSLIVLLKDGTVDPQNGITVVPASSFATPDDCKSCHVNDDNGHYDVAGHGKTTASSCTACHNENTPHSFATGADAANPLRFKFAQDTSLQSSLNLYPPMNQAFSICLTCHAQFRDKVHTGGTAVAGCNDCHEPHGTATGGDPASGGNIKMLKRQIESRDVNNNPVYAPASGGVWPTVVYTASTDSYKAVGTGLCDVPECHQGRTFNGDALYPMSSLMTANRHTGGNLAAGTDCKSCHSHTDTGGSFAANLSCTSCHGMPPVGTSTTGPGYTTISELDGPHKRHAADTANGGYGIACQACHSNYSSAPWHNSGAWNNTNQSFGSPGQQSYQSVYFDVTYSPRANNTVTGASPFDYAGSYNNSTRVCSDLYCHSNGLNTNTVNVKTAAGTGTADGFANNDAIAWTGAGWSAANLACNACHGGIDNDGSRIATGAHADHMAKPGITCNMCHSSVVTTVGTNANTTISGITNHVNRTKEVVEGGTFNSVAVDFVWNGTTCATVSCHGGWKTIAWNATPSCTNCHNYPPDNTIAGTTNHALSTPANIGVTRIKGAHENCATCHGVSALVDATPVAFGTPKDLTANGGDAYVISTHHIDGLVQMNGISGTNNNQSAEYNEATGGCAKACHDPAWALTTMRAANVINLRELGAGSCDGCHGDAGTSRYWPNGGTPGVDNAGSEDDDGEHTVHMTALAQRLYGESLATLITTTGNGDAGTKQKAICEYCHAATVNDDGHSVGDDAEVFSTTIASVVTRKAKAMNAVADANATYAAGACTNVDCHNNKSTASTYNWYANSATACTMCHTAGGAGFDPVSGIHSNARISANLHDDSFNNGAAGTATCITCHSGTLTIASQTGTHDNGIFEGGNGQTTQMALFATYIQTADNAGTCAPTGGLSACHDDGGAWARVWSTSAGLATGAECANCHGGLTTAYAAGSYVAGMSNRHSDAQVPANHGTCDYCHEYNNGSTTPYNLGTMHRDGLIQLNATQVADLGYVESGTAPNKRIGCTNCHSGTDDATGTFANGLHEFEMMTDGTRWTRANLDGAAYDCTGCHNTNGATHTGTNESATVHNTHTGNTTWITGCNNCHSNNGPGTGTGHQDGTISFGGTRMTAAFNYTLASNNFSTGASCAAAANGCHDAAAATWVTPSGITCANCHNAGTSGVVDAGKIMDQGNYPPTSGSHTNHLNTTTGAGATCADCHGTNAAAGTHTGHQNNLVTMGGAGSAYTGGLVLGDANNAGTCGVNTCHNNGQNAAADTTPYNWGTAIGAINSCTECHGDTAALMTTQVHAAHLNATPTFGLTITCANCHGTNAQTLATHANGTINLTGTTTFTYTGGDVTVATLGGTFGTCGVNACHNDGTTTAQAANPAWSATGQPNCTICHQDLTAMVSNSHNEHMNAGYTGAACVDCHTGANVATHLNGSTTFDAAKVTYSKTASFVNDATATGTCATASCHNKTGVGVSVAWDIPTGTGNQGVNDLTCNSCHYWAASPTAAGASGYAGGGANAMSVSHGEHFTAAKNCNHCHAAVTDTTHITVKTSLATGAVATLGEAAVAFTSNGALEPDYTYNTTEHSCYTPTNNGIGCHATGGLAGAADATRPDWDTAIAAGDCTSYCHTNTTTAAVNPVSGLHSVVPSVTGQQHNQSVTGGCAACHTTLPAGGGTHMNGTLNGNGSLPADRTSMGLFAAYTNGGSDNTGTCANTAAGCHDTTRNTWAHKWVSTANYYTTNTSACGGCHGDWLNGWNTNVDHRISANAQTTHGTGTTWECKDCHALEATSNTYTFTFGTNDWFPLNATSKHGDGNIQVNNNGLTYNTTTRVCQTCHTAQAGDGIHNFVATGWTIANISGDTINISCGQCHTGGVTTSSASGAHAAHGADQNDLTGQSTNVAVCSGCHGATHYTGATHNNGTLNFSGPTYSAAQGVLTGTCTNATCHYGTTTPAWNTTMPAAPTGCTKCHNSGTDTGLMVNAWPSKNKNGTARSDIHQKHSNPQGGSYTFTLGYCTYCHPDNSVTHSDTSDGVVALAGRLATGYTAGTGSCTPADMTSPCHDGTGADFRSASVSSTWATTNCLRCHATGRVGALVTTASTHTDADGTAATWPGANACVGCHKGHADDSASTGFGQRIATTYTQGRVPTMNNQYLGHGSQIQLGIAATTQAGQATEAGVCWTCHDSIATYMHQGVSTTGPVSEWGMQTNSATGSSTFNQGYLFKDIGTSTTLTTASFQSDWTQGFWRSGKGVTSTAASSPYWYKRGKVVSTHTANFDTGSSTVSGTAYRRMTETLDTADKIRCSWCHDVHGTHNGHGGDVLAGNGTTWDTPYLRGKYISNKYEEDGAPQWGMGNWFAFNSPTTTSYNYGRVPRANASISNSGLSGVARVGGWWIDQNSGNPTSAWTASQFGGLCANCHAGYNKGAQAGNVYVNSTSPAGTWSATDIDSIDWVTGENLWTSSQITAGTNGHANSVKGGSGAGTASARNIFSRTKRGHASANLTSSVTDRPISDMGNATISSGGRIGGYRANYTVSSYGYGIYPVIYTNSTASTGTYADNESQNVWKWFAWNSTYIAGSRGNYAIAAGTAQLNIGGITAVGSAWTTENETTAAGIQSAYHTFSCSKCHSAHAANLPKLLITNCLDTNHNTWDNFYGTITTGAGNFTNKRASNWATSQNCHRLDSSAPVNGTITNGRGWNIVSPWSETSTPDTWSNTAPASTPKP